MSFNSVERVVEFLEMDQEAPTITDVRPPKEVSLIFSSCFNYIYSLFILSVAQSRCYRSQEFAC